MSRIPLLSAALIVKDEEAVIERCLASLQGFVDEIVVLDTGSSDATAALCEAHGARVVHGEWYDDFGRSRNEAIGHCTGRWVLVIDADEALRVSDVAAVRELLRSSKLDGFQVAVDSFSDDSGTVGATHLSIRVFNPARAHYVGRLHEQVQHRRPGKRLKIGQLEQVTMSHWGYLGQVVTAKNKTERNLRISHRAIADGGGIRAVVDLGRTLIASGDPAAAQGHLEEGRHSEDTLARRTALKMGIPNLVALGRPEEALDWAQELKAASQYQAVADSLEAEVLMGLGRTDEAIAILERYADAGDLPDDDSVGVTGSALRTRFSHALLAVGRVEEAVDMLLSVATTCEVAEWPRLVSLLHELGQLDRGVAALDLEGDAPRVRLVFAALLAAPVQGVVDLAEALWERYPGSPQLVAFAPMLAAQMNAEEALLWAARVRSAGLSGHCPLVLRARNEELPAKDRLISAAIAHEAFADPRGTETLGREATALPVEDFVDVLYILDEIANSTLEPFIVAACHDTSRCIAMAKALDHHGERQVAINVLAHGLSVTRQQNAEALAEAEGLLAAWA